MVWLLFTGELLFETFKDDVKEAKGYDCGIQERIQHY
jgi:hypothetical protein